MTVADWQAFLLWCLGLNLGLLLWWFALFSWAHDAIYRLHSRWFKLSVEAFDAVHYGGMALYKILIFMFLLMPWLALTFMS